MADGERNDAHVPLFDLDLGANGGRVAPEKVEDLVAWILTELTFWDGIERGGSFDLRRNDLPLGRLQYANETAQAASAQPGHTGETFSRNVEASREAIRQAYVNGGLPHSSTPLGRQIRAATDKSNHMGTAYLWALTANLNQGLPSNSVAALAGVCAGASGRFELFAPSSADLAAEARALADLRQKEEGLLGDKRAELLDLRKNYERLAGQITEAAAKQDDRFKTFITGSEAEHTTALHSAREAIEAFERTYNEKLALRAPVEYWKSRQDVHQTSASKLRKWIVSGFGALSLGLCAVAGWVFYGVGDTGHPDAWKGALAVLLAVVGIWAMRLLIRMYLSDVHLGVDAAERGTMMHTYLALLEGEKVTDADRTLMLQSIFRPASDGMVKDEGVPHVALEWLTKQGKG